MEEFRSIETTFEIRSTPDTEKLYGVAIKYNQPSCDEFYTIMGYREYIKPGALTRSLDKDIRLLWNHNTQYILGRTRSKSLTLEDRVDGLYFENLPPRTAWARDLMESIRRGDVVGCSFKGLVQPNGQSFSKVNGELVRTITNLSISEITICGDPVYESTNVVVRSISDTTIEFDGKTYSLEGNPSNGELTKVERDISLVDLEYKYHNLNWRK